MQLIPTILEKEFNSAEGRLEMIGQASRWIQIDVIDGEFTEGKSFELELLKNIENKLWDIHLMVKEPIKWTEKCMYLGASRVIGQVEKMSDRDAFINKLKSEGVEAGLGIDIKSDIGEIPEETDIILLMGRMAGFGSFDLDERIWKKIELAKKMKQKVAIDGGVNIENIDKIKNAGVDIVYSGKDFFNIFEKYGKNY
jgi:ribulose-phosphate 3-epimerase